MACRESFSLTARVGTDDGLPVLLPLPGQGQTRVRDADITLGFDARKGNGWTANAVLSGLETTDLTLDQAQLRGSGRIDRVARRNGVGATLALRPPGWRCAMRRCNPPLGPGCRGRP